MSSAASSEISTSARSPCDLLVGVALALVLVLGGVAVLVLVLVVLGRACASSAISSEERSSRTERPKARWFSMCAEKPVEVAPGPLLDEIAPEIDDLRRRRRRLDAGQPLAHHEGDRVLDRRVRPVGDVLVFAAAMVAVLEHGREVVGDARHAPRADRLDARLLDRVEDRAGRLSLGREPAMDAGVVAGEPQRHRIGMAAHDRDVLRG